MCGLLVGTLLKVQMQLTGFVTFHPPTLWISPSLCYFLSLSISLLSGKENDSTGAKLLKNEKNKKTLVKDLLLLSKVSKVKLM